jgi:hypothetical protein
MPPLTVMVSWGSVDDKPRGERVVSSKGPRRDGEKERFWREAICRQRRSGRSVRGFCRDEALSEPSFYAWRRELKQRGKRPDSHSQRWRAKPSSFVAVQLAAETVPATAGTIELALPGGVVLRLPANTEPATIAAIVTAWERERC